MSMQAIWMTHRSMTADQSVRDQKLRPGTIKRIVGYATPYKGWLIAYLVTVVIDALLV
jgi:ATP-binding cassette subfamily B protein